MKCRSITAIAILLVAGRVWVRAQNTAGSVSKDRVPGMALGMLDQVKQARSAIAAKDQQAALQHVTAAIELADTIRKQSPPEKQPLLIPIYTELNKVSYLTDVKKGKHEVSGKVSANRMKKNTSVSQVSGQYTRVLVNVTDASEQLQQARKSLLENHIQQADDALQTTESGVVEKSVNGDLPLLRVKENLDLARTRVLENKAKEAAAPLEAAVRGLDQYAKLLSPGPRVEEARYLAGQIDSYAGTVRRDHSHALEFIDVWLDKVNTWIDEMTQ